MNQIKLGILLNYILIVVNAVVGLLYTPYMLRQLGQTEFGLYSLAASVIAYLTIMDFGFGNAIIRYTAKFRALNKLKEQYSLLGMFLIVYSIIGCLVFLIGMVLYFNVDVIFNRTMSPSEMNTIRELVFMMVFNLAITFPFSVFGSIISAYEQFVFQKALNLLRIVLNTLVMIVLLTYGYKAFAMVVVQTIFNIIVILCNFFFCKKYLKIKFLFCDFDKSLLKEILIYSFWIFLNVIMDRVYWSTGQFVLGSIVGAVSVAIFSLGIHFQGMYMSFSTAISGVFLPKITRLVSVEHNEQLISDIFIRTGRIQYIVMAFILSGFIVFGKLFIKLWAGEGYDESYIITLIFFLALLIPLIQNIGITILQARNQMKFRSILYIGIAIISLVLQVILSKRYGAIGCAAAIGGALLLGQGLIMNIYYQFYQRINILRFWKEILSMSIVPVILIILGCICVKLVNCDSILVLILEILIFSIAYLILFWNFSMNDSERTLVYTPFYRVLKKVFRKND